MTVPRVDTSSREWCRVGRIIGLGLVLVLLATGLPVDHSHPFDESSAYDGQCAAARLALGAPEAPLPERTDGVVALVQCPTDVQLPRAQPSFRSLPSPAWRAPPA
jgi:hypothetical protein